RVVVDRPASGEKRPDAVGEPEGGEDVSHLLGVAVSDIALGVHHGNVRGKSILAPHVEDVADELRLTKQVGPHNLTRWIWVMLEAHEGHIRDTVARLQLIDETAKP